MHTPGLGLARTVSERARIPHVFAGSPCLQGLECSSSPTSGTTFSLVRGDFVLTCVQSLGWGDSDAVGAGFGLAAVEPMQGVGWRVIVPGW